MDNDSIVVTCLYIYPCLYKEWMNHPECIINCIESNVLDVYRKLEISHVENKAVKICQPGDRREDDKASRSRYNFNFFEYSTIDPEVSRSLCRTSTSRAEHIITPLQPAPKPPHIRPPLY